MIIVTGGAGFIGSALVSRLNEAEISNILIVDKLRSTEKWKNLVGKSYSDFIDKDEFLTRLNSGEFQDVSAIIHMGACSATTELDADYLMHNNFKYSRTLAEWCLQNNVRYIYASSAATYGDGKFGYSDSHNQLFQLKPLNMYGYSKQLMDEWVLRNKLENKLVGLKFFNVFGPNEYHKNDMRSVVCKAYKQILETGKSKIFNSYHPDFADGEQKRDFVYVKDVVEVIFRLINDSSVNGIYNIGTGKARTFRDLVLAVFHAMKLEPDIEIVDMPEHLRGKYQYFTQAEMNKLAETSCNVEMCSLETAVDDYINNHLKKDWIHY